MLGKREFAILVFVCVIALLASAVFAGPPPRPGEGRAAPMAAPPASFATGGSGAPEGSGFSTSGGAGAVASSGGSPLTPFLPLGNGWGWDYHVVWCSQDADLPWHVEGDFYYKQLSFSGTGFDFAGSSDFPINPVDEVNTSTDSWQFMVAADYKWNSFGRYHVWPRLEAGYKSTEKKTSANGWYDKSNLGEFLLGIGSNVGLDLSFSDLNIGLNIKGAGGLAYASALSTDAEGAVPVGYAGRIDSPLGYYYRYEAWLDFNFQDVGYEGIALRCGYVGQSLGGTRFDAYTTAAGVEVQSQNYITHYFSVGLACGSPLQSLGALFSFIPYSDIPGTFGSSL